MSQADGDFDAKAVAAAKAQTPDGPRDNSAVEEQLTAGPGDGPVTTSPGVMEAVTLGERGLATGAVEAPPAVLDELSRRYNVAGGIDLGHHVEQDAGKTVMLRLGDDVSKQTCVVRNLLAGTPYQLWDVQTPDGTSVTDKIGPSTASDLEPVLAELGKLPGAPPDEGLAKAIDSELLKSVTRRVPTAIPGADAAMAQLDAIPPGDRAGAAALDFSGKVAIGLADAMRPLGGLDVVMGQHEPFTDRTLHVSLPRKTDAGWVVDSFAVACFDDGSGVPCWHGVDVDTLSRRSAGPSEGTGAAQTAPDTRYRSWATTAELVRDVLGAVLGGRAASIEQWHPSGQPGEPSAGVTVSPPGGSAAGYLATLQERFTDRQPVVIIVADDPQQVAYNERLIPGEPLIVRQVVNLAPALVPGLDLSDAALVRVQRPGDLRWFAVPLEGLHHASTGELILRTAAPDS